MNPVILSVMQIVTVLLLAPLVVGLLQFFQARFQGRQGAAPWLTYVAYAKLLKKENVLSKTSSWVTRSTPHVVLGSSLFIALVLPLVAVGGALAGLSNFLVVAGVLALGAIWLVLGSVDGGSAIGGLGASREMTLLSLLQPTIILTFTAFALATGSANIDGMITGTRGTVLSGAPYLLLSLLALALIILAENTRYPLDNPSSEQELSMVRPATLLEYSGPYLAMLEYAGAIKLTVFGLLIANLILPWPLLLVTSSAAQAAVVLLSTLVKLLVAVLVLTLLESTIVQMRFYRVQEFLTGAFFVALTGLVLGLLTPLL